MRRHDAAWIWLGPGRTTGPARLTVGAGGRILELRRLPARIAPAEVLLPALVDAHVHLGIAALACAPDSFADWLHAVVADRRAAAPARLAAVTRRHLRALRGEGTLAVGETDSTGASPPLLAASGIAGRCYQELVGIDLDARAAAAHLRARTPAPVAPPCASGWSAHAPYSVSLPLLRAAAQSGAPLQVHLAESEAELQFLRSGRGPLRDLLGRLGKRPLAPVPFGRTPLDWLARGGALHARTTLIHCQHLGSGEAERIRVARAAIVVCPGTITWFRRDPPPVAAWLALGIPVALGTDSRASNRRLSMRHELALARRLWPGIAPGRLLRMGTTAGARAIACPTFGRFRRGARAAFLRVPLPAGASVADVEDRFTAGELPVLEAWLGSTRALARNED